MQLRAVLVIVIMLAAAGRSGSAADIDGIRHIPRIGFKVVTRVAAGGICGRIADALIAREKLAVAEGDASEAVLIVRPVEQELFPKHISAGELFERLSNEHRPCSDKGWEEDARALVYEKKTDGRMLRVLSEAIDECSAFQTGIFCVGSLLDPGSLRVEFTRGSIRAGLAQLQKAFGLSAGMARQMPLTPEHQRIVNEDPDSPQLPTDFFIRYFYRVEPRQEEPWAFILNRLPYIERADRVPQLVAAVEAVRIFGAAQEVNRLPRSPLAQATIPIPNAQARSLAFMHEWFAIKGGILKVVKQDDNRVQVRIDRLRGEIVRQEKFWEYLRLNLILKEDKGQTTLYLMNDGYYAAGLGDRVPPDTSFKVMEQDYHGNLTEYTEALATQIQDRLKGQP